MEITMKRTLLGLLCMLFLVFLTTNGLFAQTTGDEEESEVTVEELYLQSIEMRIIGEQAQTLDRDMKLLALRSIEEMMENGSVSEGAPEIHQTLDYLSMEGIGRKVTENGRVINYFPEVRRRACELLGDLGGDNSIQTLLEVLNQDDEPMVLAEAAYALGKIGDAKQGLVLSSLYDVVVRQQAKRAPDNNFAFAALLTVEKIAEQNGGYDDPTMATTICLRIAQGNYISKVELKALAVIEKLKTYKR